MSIKCPKCQSEQITSHKKGFGIGKAIIGALTFGGVGVLAGSINQNKVLNHCMNCGYKWKPSLNDDSKTLNQTQIEDLVIKKETSKDKDIPKFSKEEYNKEVYKRTGMSASNPKFAKLGKSKKRRR